VSTPNLDALVDSEALLLQRHYVHKICSPTRCALQTGRAPVHVNVQNVVPEVYNPKDKEGGYQGIPLDMTGVAEHLTAAGYSTHLVGKWDAGMAHPKQSPWARGYSTWLGYWHHANDYWTQVEDSCGSQPIKDLWRHNATFSGQQSPMHPPCVH
jgi:arylsulfatase I/J